MVTPPAPTYPTNAMAYYYLLSGFRADSEPFINPGMEAVKLLVPDNPADPDGWSMCSQASPIRDRRFFMSMGIERLDPGTINDMTFAVIVQPQPEQLCPDITELIASAELLKPLYFSNFYCNLNVDTNEQELLNPSISVFPNPATDQLNFEISGEDSILSVDLYRIDGQLVRKLANLASNRVELSRNELAAGSYLYQVQTQKGNSVDGKIILK